MVLAPPPATLIVNNGGNPQTLFMSFGLLNRLSRHLGNIDRLPILAVDPELQETILIEVFTPRDKQGNVLEPITSLEQIEISLDDADKVLDFVGDHIANFFTRTAEKAQARAIEIDRKMTALSNSTPTKTGSSS